MYYYYSYTAVGGAQWAKSKKECNFLFKGKPHFLPYFSSFRAIGWGLSLNCTLHVVIKMHYIAAAHAQFMCYFVQKKYYPEGYN